jgi:hypothetical protein
LALIREARVSAGDAAGYARANDEAEFAARIDELLRTTSCARQMGRRGEKRIKTDLWRESSRRTLIDFYDRFFAVHR